MSTVDEANRPVPLDARMPRGALAMAWWGICSAMFYLFLGATLGLNYGTQNALIGMVLTVIVFGVANGLLARYSARTGLSSSALSQAMLGSAGGALATLILSATALYYAVFEGSVLAVAMAKVFPGVGYVGAAVIIALYSVPMILGSVQNWLNRFNGFLLPFYLVGLALVVYLTVSRVGYSSDWLHLVPAGGAPAYGWWHCLIAYLGVLILSMYTLDFARFAQPADAEFHARVSFGMPFYFVTFLVNGVVGILLVGTVDAKSLTETTVVESTLAVLGSGVGLAWIWVTQTRINSANYYLSTINLQAFLQSAVRVRVSKLVCAIVVGLVVLVLTSSTNVFSYLLVALAYQGVFVTAWVGIALAYVLGRRDRVSSDTQPRGHGIWAWFIGVIAGVLLMQFGGAYASFSVPAALLLSAAAYRLSPSLNSNPVPD